MWIRRMDRIRPAHPLITDTGYVRLRVNAPERMIKTLRLDDSYL